MKRVDYDAISATYDGVRSVNSEMAGALIGEAGLSPGTRVLDIGCGTGNIEAALEGLIKLDSVGVDLSHGMLAEAKAKVPSAKWIRADSANLPLQAERFNFVFMVYMLHHLADIDPTMRDAYRVLGEGRLAIVTASHDQIDNSFISRFFPSYAKIDKARFPKINAITSAMKDAGFVDIASRAINVAKVSIDEEYILKVENKHVSTFHLMSDAEFQKGLDKMRRYVREHEGDPPFDHMGTLIFGRKRIV